LGVFGLNLYLLHKPPCVGSFTENPLYFRVPEKERKECCKRTGESNIRMVLYAYRLYRQIKAGFYGFCSYSINGVSKSFTGVRIIFINFYNFIC
jgi:hypothetical protein